MGETRKRMKETGGGGGGGGFIAQSRTLPRTNFPHLHHRSLSHPHTFPYPHYHSHSHAYRYPAARDLLYVKPLNVSSSGHSNFEDDEEERTRHHGLFSSETDTDDGKVTSVTRTPSPHHLLNDSNETQTEEDDETTLREILVRYVRVELRARRTGTNLFSKNNNNLSDFVAASSVYLARCSRHTDLYIFKVAFPRSNELDVKESNSRVFREG